MQKRFIRAAIVKTGNPLRNIPHGFMHLNFWRYTNTRPYFLDCVGSRAKNHCGLNPQKKQPHRLQRGHKVLSITIDQSTLNPPAMKYWSQLERHCGDNNTDGVLTSLQAMNQAEPSNHDLWFHSGLSHYQLKKYPQAAEAFHQALQLLPHEARYALNLAMVHHTMGNHSQALNFYEQAKNISPDQFSHYTEMAQALCKLRRLKEARKCYGVALSLDNNKIKALIGFAQLEQLEKNFSKAIEIYDRVLKLDPTQKVAINNLGYLILERNLRGVLGGD